MLLLTSAFLWSLLKGKGPEIASATALVAMFVVSILYWLIIGDQDRLNTVDLGTLIIDLLTAAALIVIALRANRMYTLWLAGFQIIATFAHLARGLSDAISPLAYAIMYIGPSYFQIIILGFGIWAHQRRVSRHGTYRSWRTSSLHSPEMPPPN